MNICSNQNEKSTANVARLNNHRGKTAKKFKYSLHQPSKINNSVHVTLVSKTTSIFIWQEAHYVATEMQCFWVSPWHGWLDMAWVFGRWTVQHMLISHLHQVAGHCRIWRPAPLLAWQFSLQQQCEYFCSSLNLLDVSLIISSTRL